MKESHLYALHGFLGTPKDWEVLSNISHTAVNLMTDFPIIPFWEWAKLFNQQVTATSHKAKQVLLGYSLGGRLALHAVLQQPCNWNAAIFISTHCGLSSQQEREQRRNADALWAARFESEPWTLLMEAWNNQKVFHGDAKKLERCGSDYQRPQLASILRQWSLGLQEDLQPRLSRLDLPILWLVGENDEKFKRLAGKMQWKHPKSTIILVANSGHRLPWEQPKIFMSHVERFLDGIKNDACTTLSVD